MHGSFHVESQLKTVVKLLYNPKENFIQLIATWFIPEVMMECCSLYSYAMGLGSVMIKMSVIGNFHEFFFIHTLHAQ